MGSKLAYSQAKLACEGSSLGLRGQRCYYAGTLRFLPGIWATLLGSAIFAMGPASVRADVWSFTDKQGVVHFTNIRPGPRGPNAKKWKRVQRDDPTLAKVVARRGDCDRCDRVPARDRSPERFSRYDDFINEAATLYQLPEALIRAVIKVESDYDPRVVSVFGARGLMQLMPAVLKDMGVTSAHDPRQNILGGTRLLRVLANRYQGDLVLTIAAYHAGVGSLAKYGDKVPPYEHTRMYLRMVLRRYYKYADAERRAL